MVPIDLQVQPWEETMKILDAWSTNAKVNQGMKVVISALFGPLTRRNRFPQISTQATT